MSEEDVVDEEKADIVRVMLPPEQLIENDWDANEMSDKEFARLVETIQVDGFIDPVTAVEVEDAKGRSYYRIIGGKHRTRAALHLKMNRIPVDLLQDKKWQDEDLQKFQSCRLNVIHGNMNPEKFVKLYNEMAGKYGAESVGKMMGYTKEHGIKKMVQSVAKSMKASLPKEMADKFEEQAQEARTVGDIERIIQQLFQEHGDSVKYNFMVFAWGGKEHVYIAMNKRTREAMKTIMKVSRKAEVDINELIGDAIEGVARSLTEKKAAVN